MRLEKSLFDIPAEEYADRLCEFIRASRQEMNREGILVPFSGGVDSSTVLLLCLRAVGKENLRAVLLPEKQGNPDAVRYARLLADRFGIKTVTRDISPVLEKLGVYDFFLAKIPSRAIQETTTRTFLKAAKANPFLDILRGRAGLIERKGFSLYNTKHRVRAVVMFQMAEELNFLVAGCAHKSEDMLGLFVKFGVDDNADLMPLKNLYRTQILQLARYLGVPDEICSRTPNPDIIPGISDKYQDILNLSSDLLDLLLLGFETGLSDAQIAEELSLPLEKVQEIRDIVQRTAHMRSPSQSISW